MLLFFNVAVLQNRALKPSKVLGSLRHEWVMREHWGQLMLDKSYNKIVQCLQATLPAEINQILDNLPLVVGQGIPSELDHAGEAHRYHAHAQRAYYFRREGPVLTVWSWNEIYSYKEAGDIHTLILKLGQRLNEKRAADVYARATGRSVGEPSA